jgi:NADH-quinone oxidoreductase subunit C
VGLKALVGTEVAIEIEAQIPQSVISSDATGVLVESRSIAGVMRFLKDNPEFDFNYLNNLTAVDYYEYFEVVYNITSMKNKQTLQIKTRVYSRENPEIPSVSNLWRGADYQEREVFDLMGIRFSGHPDLRRIALWEGFEGHPQRKDFL